MKHVHVRWVSEETACTPKRLGVQAGGKAFWARRAGKDPFRSDPEGSWAK